MTKINLICKEHEPLYVTITDSYANKNTLDIYIKFISYFTDEDIIFLDNLIDKDISLLTQVELDKYYKLKAQLNMSELFKKYRDRKCTDEEHDIVLDFMKNNSLKSFVRKSVNADDKVKAYKFIEDLFNESIESLKEYIDLTERRYDELSVYDSYVLFEAKEYLYRIEQGQLNEKIESELLEHEKKLRKSLIRNYGLI